jgi:hypothetical protein
MAVFSTAFPKRYSLPSDHSTEARRNDGVLTLYLSIYLLLYSRFVLPWQLFEFLTLIHSR